MIKAIFLIGALSVAVLISAATTSASTAPSSKELKHDRDVIQFFVKHPKQAKTPAGQLALWKVLDHVTKTLGRSLQSKADARAAAVAAAKADAAQPAHLALWRCIAGYPGARPGGDSGESGGSESASNGSHFNILQMTNPWAGINPIGMSAQAIMQKAEEQYALNGYSHTWLNGQWEQTIGPCWGYA